MTAQRWTHAFDSGAIGVSPGAVCVIGARADCDYSAFKAPYLQTDWANHTRDLTARGHVVAQDMPEADAFETALVQIVKSKPRSLAMIAAAYRALRPGGTLMIDGPKTEGIESVLKTLRAELSELGALSKAHGKLLWVMKNEPGDPLRMWDLQDQTVDGSYVTRPGVFSADGPDRGSEVLLAALCDLSGSDLTGHGADFGAGWGYLSAEVLKTQPQISALDLIEADKLALNCAERNVKDLRARIMWEDVTALSSAQSYDFILSNPPFHTGRAADPSLGVRFIEAAAASLSTKGRFFMVANRHLPYEHALKECFATGRLIAEAESYKLYEASKPKRKMSRR
ncbi:MAG: class I SAM-dependent methyltransferase [Pseudomonadota bacterium]